MNKITLTLHRSGSDANAIQMAQEIFFTCPITGHCESRNWREVNSDTIVSEVRYMDGSAFAEKLRAADLSK